MAARLLMVMLLQLVAGGAQACLFVKNIPPSQWYEWSSALFAGEVSAHYYFRDFSQADTGVVPFLVMLELLSQADRPLSELLAPYRERYFLTGELNTPVADVALKLQEIKERYTAAGGRISHLDGISVDFDDWHFNVRPSNTEPLLRLNLEALSEPLMEEKRDEVLELIRS